MDELPNNITQEEADIILAAWDAATPTQRLRMDRVEWLSDGEATSYFLVRPSALEIAAAERIDGLLEAIQEAHNALDDGLGSADFDIYESVDEMRDEDPLQWATYRLAVELNQV